jgi:hypothetical protein
MGRELQLELLDSLRAALEHLQNLRMTDPKDPYISDLKCKIREKIAQIEDDEDARMAGD